MSYTTIFIFVFHQLTMAGRATEKMVGKQLLGILNQKYLHLNLKSFFVSSPYS